MVIKYGDRKRIHLSKAPANKIVIFLLAFACMHSIGCRREMPSSTKYSSTTTTDDPRSTDSDPEVVSIGASKEDQIENIRIAQEKSPNPLMSEALVTLHCNIFPVQRMDVTNMKLMFYSQNKSFSKTFAHPWLSTYLFNKSPHIPQRVLPLEAFEGLPDGKYTGLFCSGQTGKSCHLTSSEIQNLAKEFPGLAESSYTMEETSKIYSLFNVAANGLNGHMGGLPTVEVAAGKPVRPGTLAKHMGWNPGVVIQWNCDSGN